MFRHRQNILILVVFLAVAAGSCSSTDNRVTAAEAVKIVGTSTTVCDVVADVREDPVSPGLAYLDLVHPDPNQVMTVVIRDHQGAPRYVGAEVCTSGLIESRGSSSPRLVVDSPAQVRVEANRAVSISAAEFTSHTGQVVRVCDVVSEVRDEPASELISLVRLGTSEPPLVVTIEDRRKLPGLPETVGKRACVTGYLSDQGAIVLRDPREFAPQA